MSTRRSGLTLQRVMPAGGLKIIRFRQASMWFIIIGIIIRLSIWYFIPAETDDDELKYYLIGSQLAQTGDQQLWWPPATTWLIALFELILGPVSIKYLRLLWIALDGGVLFLLRALAARLAATAPEKLLNGPVSLPTLVVLFYAFYIPAIGFSQFIMSEIPALFLVLLILLILTSSRSLYGLKSGLAGFLTGLLILTRSNLAGFLVTIPVAILLTYPSVSRKVRVAYALAFFSLGTLIVGSYMVRNWWATGYLTVSTNSYYNLYIGNKEFYSEDLNLFNPWATPEQIEDRRIREFPDLNLTYAEMQDAAVNYVVEHPLLFLRRAFGRLARIFVPKTAQLQLLGGETHVSVFSLPAIVLLVVAALQWGFLLLAGFAGLMCLGRSHRRFQIFIGATIVGSILLSLIAISKPRYSFPFEPLLIICAFLFLLDFRKNLHYLQGRHGWESIILLGFFAWSWLAWLIFAFSSRMTL